MADSARRLAATRGGSRQRVANRLGERRALAVARESSRPTCRRRVVAPDFVAQDLFRPERTDSLRSSLHEYSFTSECNDPVRFVPNKPGASARRARRPPRHGHAPRERCRLARRRRSRCAPSWGGACARQCSRLRDRRTLPAPAAAGGHRHRRGGIRPMSPFGVGLAAPCHAAEAIFRDDSLRAGCAADSSGRFGARAPTLKRDIRRMSPVAVGRLVRAPVDPLYPQLPSNAGEQLAQLVSASAVQVGDPRDASFEVRTKIRQAQAVLRVRTVLHAVE